MICGVDLGVGDEVGGVDVEVGVLFGFVFVVGDWCVGVYGVFFGFGEGVWCVGVVGVEVVFVDVYFVWCEVWVYGV